MALKLAHFRAVKELAGFDFEAQPSVDPKQIRDLAASVWKSSWEIGAILKVSKNTVNFHLKTPNAKARYEQPQPVRRPADSPRHHLNCRRRCCYSLRRRIEVPRVQTGLAYVQRVSR